MQEKERRRRRKDDNQTGTAFRMKPFLCVSLVPALSRPFASLQRENCESRVDLSHFTS